MFKDNVFHELSCLQLIQAFELSSSESILSFCGPCKLSFVNGCQTTLALLCLKGTCQTIFSFALLHSFIQGHWKLLLWKIKISCANSVTNCLFMQFSILTIFAKYISFLRVLLAKSRNLSRAKYARSIFPKCSSRKNK